MWCYPIWQSRHKMELNTDNDLHNIWFYDGKRDIFPIFIFYTWLSLLLCLISISAFFFSNSFLLIPPFLQEWQLIHKLLPPTQRICWRDLFLYSESLFLSSRTRFFGMIDVICWEVCCPDFFAVGKLLWVVFFELVTLLVTSGILLQVWCYFVAIGCLLWAFNCALYVDRLWFAARCLL